MIKLMFICNDAALARYATQCGVDRIFVDLELHGKWERQGHRDTLISGHSMADVARVRQAIPGHELLVRLNPLHTDSGEEVEQAIAAGADLLMLPMFETPGQVAEFVALVKGRARVVPLVETPAAMNHFAQLVALPGVDELYIGLNDLHMALGMDFMFEPLANGMVEQAATLAREHGMPFGFGGIARMDEGMLSGEMVLGEHVRLGSSSVILSRTFHRNCGSVEALQQSMDLAAELQQLRDAERRLAVRSDEQEAQDHRYVVEKIEQISASIAGARA